MRMNKVVQWLITIVLIMVALPVVAAGAGPGPEVSGPATLHDSNVGFASELGGNSCPVAHASQSFCFTAVSSTTDWEYAYYVWMRFPAGWTVSAVEVLGTPYCASGGSFGSFSWWGAANNEVRITHPRYHHNPTDTCTATYCFQATPTHDTPGSKFSLISWYWSGTKDGGAPYHPCSDDGYTPAGQAACDEAVRPQAAVPNCPRTYLPIVLKGA